MPGLTLIPQAGGLAVIGSGGREIGFGRDRLGAVQTAARVTGTEPEAVRCAEPGRDARRLGGLLMVFEGNRFVGAAQAGIVTGASCLTI